eukprot:gene53050-3728_t
MLAAGVRAAVLAARLRSDVDLNGVRGWVVGHQRAPDGE